LVSMSTPRFRRPATLHRLALLGLFLAACGGIDLPETRAGSLVVGRVVSPEPIIPSGKPENASMSVYLAITNNGDAPDTLLAVSSAMATKGTLHGSMAGSGMAPLANLVIPAHGTVRMAPGGTHLMFEGLSRAIAAGDNFPLEARFARAGLVNLSSRVVTYTQFDALRGDSTDRP
jgi:periplasmic copper chaperone A